MTHALWLILLFISGCDYPVSAQNSKDPYNLSFKIEQGKPLSWVAMNQIPIAIDSTELINGKYPLQWWGGFKPTPFRTYFPIYGVLSQRISLPMANSDTLSLRLHNKTHNVEWTFMYVASYGECEKRLRVDSLNILSPEKWNTHTLDISCRSTLFVDIYFVAIGINDRKKTTGDFYQYINLDKMKMEIDHKDLYSYTNAPSLKSSPQFQLKERYIYPISENKDKSYTQLQGKKIIGLGETMHYNTCIHQSVFDIWKYQIMHNNARVLFIEAPYHEIFKANWFITCHTPTKKIIDSVKDESRKAFSEYFSDFLVWLREYNLKQERQVIIVGMDRLLKKSFFKDPLADVLASVTCSDSDSTHVARITYLLNRYQNEEALEEINQHKELIILLLGEMNGRMFINYAERLSKEFPSKFVDKQLVDLYNPQTVLLTRDDAMFEHVCEGMDTYLESGETALVYGHLAHIGRGPEAFPYRCLGYLLDQKYKNDYFPIGITVGKGETMVYSQSKKKCRILPLTTPPENSIEHAAMKISYPMFFYQLQEENKSLAQIHEILTGGDDYYADAQFKLISPKLRMDGLIFIKESHQNTAIRKPMFGRVKGKVVSIGPK